MTTPTWDVISAFIWRAIRVLVAAGVAEQVISSLQNAPGLSPLQLIGVNIAIAAITAVADAARQAAGTTAGSTGIRARATAAVGATVSKLKIRAKTWADLLPI
jgi:hypothetical protein